jgi:hypothetical protein
MRVTELKIVLVLLHAVCSLQRGKHRDRYSYPLLFVVTSLIDVTVMLAPVIKFKKKISKI